MGVSDGSVDAVVKVVDNGSDTENWNLVITGDGFTRSELGDFSAAVDDLVAYMQTQPPFDSSIIWTRINIYRIDVASDESGTDNPDCDGTTVATYFDSTLCSNGKDARLMRIDAQLAKDTADDQTPDWDALLVLVNTTVRGGTTIDGVAVRTLSSDVNEGCLHELGHAAFGLADEYPYYSGCASGETGHDSYAGSEPAEPNVTANTDPATLKWSGYVTVGTPWPTTRNADCTQCDSQSSPVAAGSVGLFEGARYYHCGLYRPEFDCRMNHNTVPHCAVCCGVIISVIGQNSSCWVATAVYGDPLHPDVVTLRRWRDRHLAPGARGAAIMRLMVAGYARTGPALARFTRPRPRLARLLRTGGFQPLARMLRWQARRVR
jgi:IgA Peptidase M64